MVPQRVHFFGSFSAAQHSPLGPGSSLVPTTTALHLSDRRLGEVLCVFAVGLSDGLGVGLLLGLLGSHGEDPLPAWNAVQVRGTAGRRRGTLGDGAGAFVSPVSHQRHRIIIPQKTNPRPPRPQSPDPLWQTEASLPPQRSSALRGAATQPYTTVNNTTLNKTDNTEQHNTGQDNNRQHRTAQHRARRHRTAQHRTINHATTQCRTRHRTGKLKTGLHKTTQDHTTQDRTLAMEGPGQLWIPKMG